MALTKLLSPPTLLRLLLSFSKRGTSGTCVPQATASIIGGKNNQINHRKGLRGEQRREREIEGREKGEKEGDI